MPLVLNVLGFGIWQGCEYATRCRICLNKPEYALIMSPNISLIKLNLLGLNKAPYTWSDVVHSIRSLYKLPSSLGRDVFRTLSII